MAQTIVLRRSAQSGKTPDTASLNLGELAINTYDGKVFLAKSSSVLSIEQVVVTNSTTTGSITIIGTGSFGEINVTNDINVSGSVYIINDIVANGDLDVLGSISGSAIKITNSTIFGNSGDDRHEFTGSVGISGSFLVNGTAVGVAPGPNTYDFNLDPSAAGTVNFIEDGVTGLTKVIAQENNIQLVVNDIVVANIGASGIQATVPAGTISGSSQLTASFDLRYALSGSSGAAAPGTVSGSSQIDITQTTNYTSFSSSLVSRDAAQDVLISSLQTNILSASIFTAFSTSVDSRLDVVELVSASAASALNSFSSSNASTDATQTTNISAASSSAAGAFASASAYSASAATVDGAQDILISSLRTNILSASVFTTFSTSVDSRLDTVELVSASAASALNSFSASNASTDNTQTTNISAASASAAGAFASASAYSASAATVDGVQDTLISSLRTNILSASVFTTFSTSVDSRLDTLEATTFSTSVDSRLDTLETFSSSITTTIKNKLNTDGVISGSSQLTASYDTRYALSGSASSNASVTISGSAPTSVSTGSLWYDNSDGKTYIYYGNDGTSSWVLQSDPTIDVNSSLQTLQEVTDLGSTTNNSITITNSTPSTGVTSGALIVSGGVGISGSVYGGKFYGDGSGLTNVSATYTETDTLETIIARGNSTSGSIVVTSTTNSTSKTTGNIRTAGGLGVAKDIWADNLYIINTISGSSVTGSFSGSFRGDGSGITGIPGTNTFSTIAVSGQSNVAADSSTDTLTLVAGSNVTITTDAGTDSITISSTGGSSGNSFATFSVAGQNNVIADSTIDTMTLVAGSGITITTNDTTDTITFTSTAANNTFATFSVAGQNNVIADTSTDTLTLIAGSNITITTNDTADSITIASTGGSAGNTFATFSVSGQNDVVADASSDTITLVAGTNITITTDSATDSITINSSAGGGNSFGTIAVSGQSDVVADTSTDTVTFVAGSGITITTDAGTDSVTITSNAAVDVNSDQKSITIYDPTNAEDVTMFYTSGSITIQRVNAVLRGTAGQSVTVTLRYASDRSTAGTAIVNAQAVTSTTTAETVTLTGNTTVPANNFIWLETTATAGTVNELFLQFSY